MKKIALNKEEKKSLKIQFEIHDVLSIKTRFLDRKHSAFQVFPLKTANIHLSLKFS